MLEWVRGRPHSAASCGTRSGSEVRWVAASLYLIALLLGAPVQADTRLFRIGTGGEQGTYFPVGELMARGISVGKQSYTAATPKSGNHRET